MKFTNHRPSLRQLIKRHISARKISPNRNKGYNSYGENMVTNEININNGFVTE